MVIFLLRNQRNGRAFVGQVEDATMIMHCEFPPSLKEDLKNYHFSTRIVCEFNNQDTIKRKIDQLLSKEADSYNNDLEPTEPELADWKLFELEDFDLV